MARGEAALKDSREDIPVAKRSVSSKWAFQSRSRRLVLLFFGIAAFVSVLLLGYRRIWLGAGPLPLAAINQEVDSDGRLLGHFPYPEIDPDKLINVYPGVMVHLDTASALKNMLSAASLDGISLSLLSGYRSHQLQKEVYNYSQHYQYFLLIFLIDLCFYYQYLD